ncbi:asparagine synthase (glutamine-hydrolyzing) [Sulfurimonas diazotrophicus]|uniref:asparagine synthase (glutamine-hydrolyzing) n=1 Tax=Sulfurimonas diazotrophicus TaxID=3131939 RepID=A0ABZ3HB95_9BACT
MCAVFGILGDYEPSLARQALAKLAHRGPDYCGIIEEKGLFFAQHRLSIRDLHERSHQPLRKGDVLLSFNGEIYNYREIAETLQLRAATEAETVLEAYLRWGIECVHRFRGMFALAIYDGGTLYLLRDRLGKKPLFFAKQKERFVFASEIKGILPFLPSVRMDDDAMMGFLSFQAPTAPYTFFEGIEKIAPGELITVANGNVSRRSYYCLLEHAEPVDDSSAPQRIEARMEESIAMRLDADVPVAALLSGGIDSAAVNAFAKKLGRPLQTFSLGYTEPWNYDESGSAAETARILGINNTKITISQHDFVDAIDPVMDALDEPLNDPAAIPLYLLFGAIKKEGYRVVLSGEGGDELFLGYRQYFDYLDIEQLASLQRKAWLKKFFHGHFSINREWEWYKRAFDETLLFRGAGEKFTDLQKNALMRRNVRDEDGLRFVQPERDRFDASRWTHPAHWYSYLDLRQLQAEYYLSKLDRVSMAHGIESRTPMLDHRLAETVFGTSAELKIGNGRPKALLKQIMRPYLGDTILNRKKKGFASPYMEYLQASGKIDLITEVNDQTGLFKKEVLERYIDAAVRRGRFKQQVWSLFVLSHWMKKHLL